MLIVASYKFVYFNVRGRGETIRYICYDQGLKFEDVIVDFAQWPTIKPTTVSKTFNTHVGPILA